MMDLFPVLRLYCVACLSADREGVAMNLASEFVG